MSVSPPVRITIQPAPDFRGKTIGPRYVAPGSRATTSPGRADSSAACRSPPPGTAMVGPGRGQHLGGVLAGVADYDDLGVGQERFGARAHQGRDVRDLFLDITAVGPDQARHRDVPVEDPDVASLADECLDERDHRALAE